MPFMIGRAPIRRTLQYLQAGELVLKDKIQIFTVNYNLVGDHHEGTRDFVFWYLPQVQYKSPHVQVVTFRNMTPSPFFRCYFEDGKQMLIDADSKTKEELLQHLINVVGKTKETLQKEAVAREKKDNPANFGVGCEKSCICEIPGQLPCPQVVPLPYHMRGKYRNNPDAIPN
ncbi:probable 28S ribosomal protein S25, mitochondrial [Orussus abietinus]|uniref:probable 28S ribosomal protein S25, mitochondrial n=1 Tax=Orussus abietinus TaxID=222816 RepID=UPI00062558FB|nr:probable 28S ribosomal protein S25, mitochondrial [Orussus abietinus]XP_012272702.1 probable 28S ribosomal protein S25, mitochondrial [Orussus abietinus]